MLDAQSQDLLRKFSFIRNFIQFGPAVAALFLVASQVQANWKAYNDHSPGTIGTQTSPNATTLNCAVAGSTNLKSTVDGSDIPGVTMTISIDGSPSTGSTAGVPDADTPLYNEFNNYVFFGTSTGPNSCIQISQAGIVHYTFSGLDPAKLYKFKGGAIRGNPTDVQGSTWVYTNRWTLADISGADSFAANHQQGPGSRWGYMDATRFRAALSGSQVAINTGVNTNGDMFEWDAINPGPDGTFEITCTQFYYNGSVPIGYGTDTQECWPNSTSYGYSISGLSLEENIACPVMEVTLGPTNYLEVVECTPVTLSARVCGGIAPYFYEWYKNGVAIEGETNATLLIANPRPATPNDEYFVFVIDSTPIAPWVTLSDVLTNVVTPETAPDLVSAVSQTDAVTITVTFDKPINISSATGGDFIVRPDSGADVPLATSYVTNGNQVVLVCGNALPQKNHNVLMQGSGVTAVCSGLAAASGSSIPLVETVILFGASLNESWQYNQAGVDLGTAWLANDFNEQNGEAGWASGNAVFDGKTPQPPGRTNVGGENVQTQLNLTNSIFPDLTNVIPSYYFKKHFSLPATPADLNLEIRHLFDDFGIIYLNGQEAYRDANIVATNEAFAAYVRAASSIGTAAWSAWRSLPTTNLVSGNNVIAVYLKQNSPISSDITMGLELRAAVTNFLASGWVAFNDHWPTNDPFLTAPFATRYDVFGIIAGNSGNLTNVMDGRQLPVILTITNNSSTPITGGGAAGVPNPGTPLANAFDGYVYLGSGGSGTKAAIQVPATAEVTYIFSGLDPNKRYRFQGGAVRGNELYTNRWTLVDIQGADSVTPNHQQGVDSPWGILNSSMPSVSLTNFQVAVLTGDNRWGDMVQWDNIAPGSDGEFTVTCTQYTGPVPPGYGASALPCDNANGPYGYAISGIRLEEISPLLTVSVSPGNQAVPGCRSITYRALASGGTPPYTYQWFKNDTGTSMKDATNASLTLSNAQPGADDGYYFVVVTDSNPISPQRQSSNPSALTVIPNAFVAAVGAPDLFTVTLSFLQPIALGSSTGSEFEIQCLHDGTLLAVTNAILTNGTNIILTTSSPRQAKTYQVTIQTNAVIELCTGLPISGTFTMNQELALLGFETNTLWRYNQEGIDLGTAWKEYSYADELSWPEGAAVFDGKIGGRTNIGGLTVGTVLQLTNINFAFGTNDIPSYYFRTHFIWPANVALSNASLAMRTLLDDAAILYVNGREVWRSPTITATNEPFSSYLGWTTGDAAISQPIPLSPTNFIDADNVLAVYLKQGNDHSSDITMGLELIVSVTSFREIPSAILNVSVQGVGTILKNPDMPLYRIGDAVVLTARTSCWWYAFSQWSDGLTANPRTVIIGSNNSYTAIFTNTVPLETNTFYGVTRIAPVGMPMIFVGTDFIVASPYTNRGPAQITLLSTLPGATILYTLDGSDPLTYPTLYTGPFVIQRSTRLRAVAIGSGVTGPVPTEPFDFVLLPTLTVTTAGGGTISVEPPDGPYLSDNTAIISCYPFSGWSFLGWLGDAAGPDPIITINMTRDKCVEGVFGTTLTTNIVFGSGEIIVDPPAGPYPFGSRVRLTALPSPGFYFFSWAGAVSDTNNPVTIQITSPNPTIRAMFVAGEYALTIIPIGGGRVQIQPYLSRYAPGQSVTNTAIPDSNQSFLNWSGDTNGATILNATNLIVSMNSNRVITASFTSRPHLTIPNCCPEQNADGYQFRIQGHVGEIYEIQVSSNLTDWAALTTLTNSTGVMSFTDRSSTNLAQRLYRAILP